MKIFWSYARLDDKEPLRKVSKLRDAFEIVLSQVLGRECEIYFDKFTLRWGVKWRDEIESLVKDADGFVAIVTPSYFNSRMCIFELQLAIEAGKRILPIYFRTCKEFKSTFTEGGIEPESNKKLNKVSLELGEIQMIDFRKLRSKKLDTSDVQNVLDVMAEEIAEGF